MAEHIRTRDADIDARIAQHLYVLRIDTAVYFDEAVRVDAVAQYLEALDLFNNGGDELLTAKSGVDAHHKDHVHIVQQVLDCFGRRVRVEDDAGLDTEFADVLHKAVRVFLFFDMEGDVAGFQGGEKVYKKGIVLDHKMDVEGFCRGFGNR